MAKPVPQWELTDHLCRACLGRLLHRETFDHVKLWRCSNCGIERDGASHTALCMCGLKLRTNVDAGIRCVRNESPSPECPSEIVAREIQPPPKVRS